MATKSGARFHNTLCIYMLVMGWVSKSIYGAYNYCLSTPFIPIHDTENIILNKHAICHQIPSIWVRRICVCSCMMLGWALLWEWLIFCVCFEETIGTTSLNTQVQPSSWVALRNAWGCSWKVGCLGITMGPWSTYWRQRKLGAPVLESGDV